MRRPQSQNPVLMVASYLVSSTDSSKRPRDDLPVKAVCARLFLRNDFISVYLLGFWSDRFRFGHGFVFLSNARSRVFAARAGRGCGKSFLKCDIFGDVTKEAVLLLRCLFLRLSQVCGARLSNRRFRKGFVGKQIRPRRRVTARAPDVSAVRFFGMAAYTQK